MPDFLDMAYLFKVPLKKNTFTLTILMLYLLTFHCYPYMFAIPLIKLANGYGSVLSAHSVS